MKIRILDEAERDLADGRRFYEAQSRGLGEYFLDSLLSDIDSLCLYAGIHSVHGSYHRLLSKRFPFAVYYRVRRGVVEIWAVVDCRQAPARIGERLGATGNGTGGKAGVRRNPAHSPTARPALRRTPSA